MMREDGLPTLSLEGIALDELDSGNILLQTAFWGRFKSLFGWEAHAYRWCWGSQGGSLLVLVRCLPGGLRMAYVPHGPILPEYMQVGEISSLLADLAKNLMRFLPSGCFMVRFDLMGGVRGSLGQVERAELPSLDVPFRAAPYRVQVPDSVILNLERGEDVLLSEMHKKTRYNVRLAMRKDVRIRCLRGTEALDVLPLWYQIYRETAQRDGIALHEESYYHRLFVEAGRVHGEGFGFRLYMAYHDGEALAGIIVSRCAYRFTYLYGASLSRKRELMPNYLLQWRAICDAIAEGGRDYDLNGIPPSGRSSHPMHGLWRFKTGFGGEVHHFLGAWDYPCRPFLYGLYAVAERFRGWKSALRKRMRRGLLP